MSQFCRDVAFFQSHSYGALDHMVKWYFYAVTTQKATARDVAFKCVTVVSR
jgi:hypothetical protein